jgi:DNA mismatch repair protein MutS
MAGKSTYLRQVALLVLMAQIGSFVPAQEAKIGITDKIFCRVGASDNISRGESTFLVEMNETAYILRSATPRSLIILDEVGRGTGTRDGMAIAWAVTEYIIGALNARTLFATHYHELTAIKHRNLVNLCMEVVEKDQEIVFLKKVKPGSSDSSYGIHVARLAGLPAAVTDSAREILKRISNGAAKVPLVPGAPSPPEEGADTGGSGLGEPASQPTLFSPGELLQSELRNLDLDKLTPLEALNLLFRWQSELHQEPRINP